MISVDFDGVLNNLLFKWIEYINSMRNTKYSINDIKIYNDKLLLDNYEFIKNENLYDNVQLLDDAQLFIKELKKLDDVQIVTQTIDEHFNSKKNFLTRYFPGVKIIYTKKNKDIAKNTILIDDCLENIERHVCKLKSIGLVYSHNDLYQYNKTDKFFRFKNYKEILNFLKKIKCQ